MVQVRIKPGCFDPFMAAEGLEEDRIYTVTVWAGDTIIINGLRYHASRFEEV